ncbi:MAG: class I adenylate-forming enzyme family protein [Kineosporiaceae bacterium]
MIGGPEDSVGSPAPARDGSQQALGEFVAGLAARPPAAVALRGAHDSVTYGELAAALASAHGRAPARGSARRVTVTVRSRASDVLEILATACAGDSPLVLDASATDWEVERAVAGFAPGDRSRTLGISTSGTTGAPKIVGLGWDDLLVNAAAFARAAGYEDSDVLWCGTPLHHRYCLAAGVLAGLGAGARVVLSPGSVGPADLAPVLLDERVTVMLSVPYLYAWYQREPARDDSLARSWSLRRCVAAGEPVPAALAARWRETTGLPLLAHYGSTEDGQISIGTGAVDEGVGPAIDGVQVRRSDSGELLVRRTDVPGRTWRATGDLGHVDDRGNVHVTGRSGVTINVAGRKVDPVEVEGVISDQPGVHDVVVAGADTDNGQEVVAFVVADDTATDAVIRSHVSGLLSPYKVPRHIRRVPEIPRTASGKPLRGRLLAGVRLGTGALSGQVIGVSAARGPRGDV